MLKHLYVNQVLYEASMDRGNESLFEAPGSHNHDGRHAHAWLVKPHQTSHKLMDHYHENWNVASETPANHSLFKAAPVAEWLRWLISLSPLIIRSSHRCDWCGFEPHTGHKWDKSSSTCGCVRWFFPGYSRFRPTFWLARLDMSEIILKGTLNWTKKKKKKKNSLFKWWPWQD